MWFHRDVNAVEYDRQTPSVRVALELLGQQLIRISPYSRRTAWTCGVTKQQSRGYGRRPQRETALGLHLQEALWNHF